MVRDLGDWGSGRSLRLMVRDLGHGGSSRSLGLAIGDDGSTSSTGCGARHNARHSAGHGTGHSNRRGSASGGTASGGTRKENLRALSTNRLSVQVAKATRVALVEDSGASKSKGLVGAERETGSVDGTSLGGLVELELVVGSFVTSVTLLVHENTILESQDQGSRVAGLALGVRRGGRVDDSDLEGGSDGGSATGGGSNSWGDLCRDTYDNH